MYAIGVNLDPPSISWRVTVGLDGRKAMCSTFTPRFICMDAGLSCSTENTGYGIVAISAYQSHSS
ncbi:uncharacterized protein N7529_001564 [Penicillium soppii]|uniref:uncharacterized protein n=1 Tax=Penicillium soppii TaxID=69789 RepID=UPI0025494499|nr:uncharacterized protein N7529_001564 [Penicillium soppii]KAJ5875980.1 hypothetical protein N7529_001564 [Penicillium soppii]